MACASCGQMGGQLRHRRPGLCLDWEDVRKRAAGFLHALVLRCCNHPSLGAYDVWYECNMPTAYGYPSGSATACGKAISVCRAKHCRHLAQRGSDTRWPTGPMSNPWRSPGSFPDVHDWLEFRIANTLPLAALAF